MCCAPTSPQRMIFPVIPKYCTIEINFVHILPYFNITKEGLKIEFMNCNWGMNISLQFFYTLLCKLCKQPGINTPQQ